MKISVNWLSDYLDVSAIRKDPSTVLEKLTMRGLEVESIRDLSQGLQHVVVAQVKEKAQHPNANKLSLCQVFDGKQTHQIVCGAQNFKQGDKVALALIGADLPNGMKIQASKIRDVESFGMLCSEQELGLKEQSEGILILEPSAELGTPIAHYLGLNDVVFEINVTPNRGDALSYLGVARELSSILGVPLKYPPLKLQESGRNVAQKIKVAIEAGDGCKQYHARFVENVKVGPSPRWLCQKLEASGIRSISNIVDITNYVLLEFGTPLHAFDADQLKGEPSKNINVRRAHSGETLKLLDDTTVNLLSSDLLITCGDQPVALAGVMGGAESEVTLTTKNVVIEAAEFASASVRSTSKRLQKHSEAAHRFERRIDPLAVAKALDRAAALMAELAGGQVMQGKVTAYAKGYEDHLRDLKEGKKKVVIHVDRMNEFLGLDLSLQDTAAALKLAGFICDGAAAGAGSSTLAVFESSHRPDVTMAEDVYEEVLRVVGYDRVTPILPKLPRSVESFGVATNPVVTRSQNIARLKQYLAHLGFSECVNFSFSSKTKVLQWTSPEVEQSRLVTIQNPLNEEFTTMKTSLLFGLYENLLQSLRHQESDIMLFEVRPVFFKDDEPVQGDREKTGVREEWRLAIMMTGRAHVAALQAQDRLLNFYDAKGVWEGLLEHLGVRGARFQDTGINQKNPLPAYWHPYQLAQLLVGPGAVGYLGAIHPSITAKDKVRTPVYALEVAIDPLLAQAKTDRKFSEVAKYPKIHRDYSFLVPDSVPGEKLLNAVSKSGKPLLEWAKTIDVYTGGKIPSGHRSISVAVQFGAKDRTLEEAEVDQCSAKMLQAVEKELNIALRQE
jgi:phenylalanyl-tRNA synthetase beta chain